MRSGTSPLRTSLPPRLRQLESAGCGPWRSSSVHAAREGYVLGAPCVQCIYRLTTYAELLSCENELSTLARVRRHRRQRRLRARGCSAELKSACSLATDSCSGTRSGNPVVRSDRPSRATHIRGRRPATAQPAPAGRRRGAGRTRTHPQVRRNRDTPCGSYTARDRKSPRELLDKIRPHASWRGSPPRG